MRAAQKLVQAPELDGAMAWLNVGRPLTLRELRGSVVVLDFWTYCCVNCMHVLPTLRAIEHKHRRDPLVVIGVHSGKFHAEQDPERIKEAIGRYGVEHPVAVDADMAIWNRYQIRSWPTLVVVRPDGTIAAVAPGEPRRPILEAFLQRELDLAKRAGTLAPAPPKIERSRPPKHRPLCYPGKVAVHADGRLAISDSGHHRVLVASPTGEVLLTVGSGLRGLADGKVSEAAFDDPQGSCWFRGALYVADARNHAIRRIDLERGEVHTVAGTGKLAARRFSGRVPAADEALRSPWDLCAVGDCIYVAMAGSHQICRFWPQQGVIEVFTGTGAEALRDGEADDSAFAQPSGLCVKKNNLYVADSETSAVRVVDLDTGRVETLVGQGLFDFGDDDGAAADALLQHCLGVAAVPEGVVIADTYNGKLKLLTEGEASTIHTVLSDLSEPGSVQLAPDGSWIVANTNAHQVLKVRDGRAEAIPIVGAPQPKLGDVDSPPITVPPPSATLGWFNTLLRAAEGTGLAEGPGRVSVSLRTAEGFELAAGSPLRVAVDVSRRSDLLLLAREQFTITVSEPTSQSVDVAVEVTGLPTTVVEAELVLCVTFVACHAADAQLCTPMDLFLRLPVRLLREGGRERVDFSVELPAPPPAG